VLLQDIWTDRQTDERTTFQNNICFTFNMSTILHEQSHAIFYNGLI